MLNAQRYTRPAPATGWLLNAPPPLPVGLPIRGPVSLHPTFCLNLKLKNATPPF